jgi:O-antigen/teichoic acid export membrane protein
LSTLKKLAGQTAIYGIPTIVGRLLNYLLVPLYTYRFRDPKDFGIQAEFYAYISFLNVILTYGMETALFNFSIREHNKDKVYSTALISLFSTTLFFLSAVYLFSGSLAEMLHYANNPNFVIWAALILATDALAAIPFAKLREQGRATRFASLKAVNICINICLNLFYFGFCKPAVEDPACAGHYFASLLYNPATGIGYIFIANLVANAAVALLLLPEYFMVKWDFDFKLWKRMLKYASPLIIVGLGGMVNETFDRILLKNLLVQHHSAEYAMRQVGIYGACYKISILMTVFVQAFRYAAEPFFFSKSGESDAKVLYASVMSYFVLACSFIFLVTTINLPLFQIVFLSDNFRSGIKVVPVLLIANLCLGVYFNLSIWYKLTNKTSYGAWLTIAGACITLLLNFWWIPRIGYMGSAWATLTCYGSMAILSFIIGHKHYPVHYDFKRILGYVTLSLVLYLIGSNTPFQSNRTILIFGNFLVLIFISIAFFFEKDSIQKLMKKTIPANENQDHQ